MTGTRWKQVLVNNVGLYYSEWFTGEGFVCVLFFGQCHSHVDPHSVPVGGGTAPVRCLPLNRRRRRISSVGVILGESQVTTGRPAAPDRSSLSLYAPCDRNLLC